MIRRLAILLLVCGGLGFFLQREQARGTFDDWERQWLDRVQRAGERVMGVTRPPEPPVVLIELRRGDLPFESWPPAPLDYALVFESLVRHRPRQVVVPSVLAWPGVDPLDAASLAERVALLPRGVLACTLERGMDGGEAGVSDAALPLPTLPEVSEDISLVPDFTGPGQVPSEELRLGKPLGFTRIEWGEGVSVEGDTPGRPGDIVRLPLLARRGDTLVPSLALQALLTWYEAVPGDVMTQLGRRLTVGSVLELPIDDGGRLRLAARLAPPLRRLDAGALLIELERDGALMAGRSEELEILRSLEGALVVLGETEDATSRLPVSGAAAGGWTEAEVLARSLVAALSGFHLREPPVRHVWVGWAAVVLVGAALLACPRRWVPVFALGGAASLVLGGALAFLHGQWWIPPVPPLGLWFAAALVAFILPPVAVPPQPAEPDAARTTRDRSTEARPGPDPGPLPEDTTWDALAGELARDERPSAAAAHDAGEPKPAVGSAAAPAAAARAAASPSEPAPSELVPAVSPELAVPAPAVLAPASPAPAVSEPASPAPTLAVPAPSEPAPATSSAPVVPELVLPEPALPAPALAEPAPSEPAPATSPAPVVPEPAVPEPAVPEPAVPQPLVQSEAGRMPAKPIRHGRKGHRSARNRGLDGGRRS